jgi:hypothetical protein
MKNFEQQYYRHKSQRPQAEAQVDDTASLFTVAFSWGEISPTEKINDSLKSYYFASKNDIEVTAPFELLPSLTPLANKIRTGLLISNSAIYNSFNNKAYAAGCEYLCIATEGRELVIAQVGGPSVIMVRNRKNFLLTTSSDLYLKSTDPIPNNLMGIENECYPQINSVRFESEDFLIFISRSSLPCNILNSNLALPLQNLTQLISQEDPNVPFWIGRLSL